MRSPGMNLPEASRCEALSNSTGSRGVARASAVSAPTAHQSISTTAAGKVTVAGNPVSLECARQQRAISNKMKEPEMSERLETLKKARDRMIEDRDTHAKVLAA